MAELKEGKRYNIELVFCFWNLGQPGFNLALLSLVSVPMVANHLTHIVNSNLCHLESKIL